MRKHASNLNNNDYYHNANNNNVITILPIFSALSGFIFLAKLMLCVL